MKDQKIELPQLAVMPAADHYSSTIVVTLEQAEDAIRAAVEADRQRRGEVVVTKDESGTIVVVTRQDSGGHILSVIAESEQRRGEPVKVPSLNEVHDAVLRFADARAEITEARCEGMSDERRRQAADHCAQAYADVWALLARYSSSQPAANHAPCDAGEICIDCQPRRADGSCPDGPAASAEPGLIRAIRELTSHLADVLPDDAWDQIDVKKWNDLTQHVGIAELAERRAKAAPVAQEPLKVFCDGPWLFRETGEEFSGAELDSAAFAVYRDHAAPVAASPARSPADSIGFCSFDPDDRFYHAADRTWWRRDDDGMLVRAEAPAASAGPIGYVTPAAIDLLRDGRFVTLCPTGVDNGVPVFLGPQPAQSAKPIHQYRVRNCADWHDGLPDHSDGKDYETRTLYASPVAAQAQPVVNQQMTTAARDVLAERRRQVTVEGWTPEHDDMHPYGVIAKAAACYATGNPRGWPWREDWWKPKTQRRNLVRAGALILAEIERIDRAAARAAKEKS